MTFPLKTPQGTHFGTFVRDVTESKRAEEALKLAQFTIETSEDEVAWMDSGARVIYVNNAACKALGYTRDELLSMNVSDLDPNFPAEKWPEFWRETREKGRLMFESTHRSLDGHIYPVEISVDFIKYGNKEFISSFARNITKRKLAEEELKIAKLQAELYLDLMGHDINNMHQIALGYLELARDMQAGSGKTEFLDKPVEVLQRSSRLIQNVRKLQRLREGVFPTQKVDVVKVVSDLQREFGAVPGKTITLNFNGHEHCYILANELIHDVFANLVSNALRHTSNPAEIIIDVDRVIYDGKTCHRVIVEDDGPGIPDDYKGRIFNRMHMGSARGMGLGLYIVKSLVDSYGGRVWAGDRVPGDYTKGVRFVVLLPAVDN
jgi:PAS domain S-box-containing protein